MSQIENVSRRRFLTGGIIAAGALVLGVRYYHKLSPGDKLPHDTKADHATLHPSVYLGIDPDGAVWIVASRSEMGTTSRTTLPLIVADELDADWKRVKIEQAAWRQPIRRPKYGRIPLNTLVLRRYACGGSNCAIYADSSGGSAVGSFGSGVRNRLARCCSPLDEPQSGLRRTREGCGEIAGTQKRRAEAQAKECLAVCRQRASELRPRSSCDRKAIYGMDARVDGMVYASVEHPPVLGGKVKSFDDKEPLKVAGVSQIIPIDPFQQAPGFQPLGGIAVIADNTWAAFQGRKKLNISWDNGANESYNSDSYKNELRATSHGPCKVVRNIGDADAVFAKGEKIQEADYYVPLLAHAAMEPLVALDGIQGRQSDNMGTDAESSSCARHRLERAGDREGRRNLPCDASRWGIWAQVEARLRC